MLNLLPTRAICLAMMFASVPCLAQTSAADNYKAKCQMCHGATGAGDTPAGKSMKARPLNSPEVVKQSDEELAAIIRNGKNKMPAYKGKLTDAEINDLVKFIRTLK